MAANASDSSNLAVVESSPHRRRSVHFDSSPTEIVGGPGGPGGPGCPGGGQQTDMSGAFPRKQADAVADGIREEEEEAETDEEDRPPSTSSPPTSSFDPKLVLRRQSAPAASIALGAATSPSGTETDDESARGSSAEGLKVLDPELRRSLTKLADIDLGTAEDLDVVNPKLIARDELEILRMRQQKKQRERDAQRGKGAAEDSAHETL